MNQQALTCYILCLVLTCTKIHVISRSSCYFDNQEFGLLTLLVLFTFIVFFIITVINLWILLVCRVWFVAGNFQGELSQVKMLGVFDLAFLSTKMDSLGTSDYKSVVSVNLFVALLCACIVVGHLLEENRWINESITALAIVSLFFGFWCIFCVKLVNGKL